MASVRDLSEHVRDLLWSQWHELGVASVIQRRHKDDCVDPEALIAFTALEGDLDPRIREESLDWILTYGTLVSRARFKNILADWNDTANSDALEYAATLNAHGSAGWPAARAKSLPFRPRSRSLLDDLTAPALLSLRIRAAFGVGARAELIRAFISRPQQAMTAAELADDTNYRKRNVLKELEPLRLAAAVGSFRVGNADRYSLRKAEAITLLVGPIPSRFTPWSAVFHVLRLLLGLTRRSSRRSDLANAAEALRLFDAYKGVFTRAGLYAPPLPAGAAAWPRLAEWFSDYARSVAGS